MSDGILFEWPEEMREEVSVEQIINIVNWAIIKGGELDVYEREMILEEIRHRIYFHWRWCGAGTQGLGILFAGRSPCKK